MSLCEVRVDFSSSSRTFDDPVDVRPALLDPLFKLPVRCRRDEGSGDREGKSVHAESLIRALMTGTVVAGVQYTYDWILGSALRTSRGEC